MTTDFLTRETYAEYHAKSKTHLSSHQLADFRACPLLCLKKRTGEIPDEDKPAYIVGRAAHCLILEGRDEFEDQYAVGGPINQKTGKPFGITSKTFQDWAEEQGVPCINDDDAEMISQMAAVVSVHEEARHLLVRGAPGAVAEGTVRVDYLTRPCQGRLDWFSPEFGLTDLKTCANLTWFESEAMKYGYVYQMAFYWALIEQATGKQVPVNIIAVEKEQPYRCGVWTISFGALDMARRDNEAEMERLAVCERDDIWPTNFESIRQIESI